MISWNVKGLGHVIKLGGVFSHLKSLKPDIIFLQETHIGVNKQCRLKANWFSQIYQASFTWKARGVAIIFRKNIAFTLESMQADPHGRFLMISGHINSFPITLLNIYGPNIDDADFFVRPLIQYHPMVEMLSSGATSIAILTQLWIDSQPNPLPL